MSTATAPEPTATETVTFIAKSPNQVLTRRKVRYVSDGEGEKTALDEQEWLNRQEDLNDSRESRGEEPKEIDRTPWKVEFAHNVFRTDNAKLIAWMRNHWLCDNPEGFWEMGAAPDEPRPSLDHQMTAIAEAAASGDIEGVEEVIKAENETHKRPSVLQVAEAAVKRLREFDPESGSGAPSGNNGGPLSTQPSS
jgi:hypothetical protein